jgi:hypothetical protein
MLFIRKKGILRPTQQMRLSLAAMTLIIYYNKRVEPIRSMSSTAIRENTGNWIIRGTYLNVSGIRKS